MSHYLSLFLLLTFQFLAFNQIRCLAGQESEKSFIVRSGRPEASIVIGDSASPFYKSLAQELQANLRTISGATLKIIGTSDRENNLKFENLLVLGDPNNNEMMKRAVSDGIIDFKGIKKDGYVLKSVSLDNRSVLFIGGINEAATMYATYDLLERLGFVFLLTKDIIPQNQPNVYLPVLNERIEPSFQRRGVHVDYCYPNQTIWSLNYWKKFLDQMAKMRMNYLQIFWFPSTPFLTYDYKGEKLFLGDATTKESGYLLWRDFGSYLKKDVEVGQEHFIYPRLAPPELQNVENPEQAFQKSQDLLRSVIAYAKTKKIETWLAIDPVSLPANLARHSSKRSGDLPYQPVLEGVYMCPADPVADQINENRLRSLLTTYPEADGYFLWFPELYPVCEDDQSREFYLKERPKYYIDQVKNWTKYFGGYERNAERVVDSNSGAIYLMKQMLEARDRINPKAKIGIGAFGRSFVYPQIDKIFPKDVPFTDMVSRAVWTPLGVPMEQFAGMGERERTLISRADDDARMLGMQFNVNMYYKDRMYEGALESGVAGHAMQIDRARGMEQNEKFLADAAWKPHLTPDQFYHNYISRIFGQAATPELTIAYKILEDNEELLGWNDTGSYPRSSFPCCGPPIEISVIRDYAEQRNPYDGPNLKSWPGFIDACRARILVFSRSAGLLRDALSHLQNAESLTDPKGRTELTYIKNKTESYAMHLETAVQLEKSYIEFDDAFRTKGAGRKDEFIQKLDNSFEMFKKAHLMARAQAAKFAEVIDDPSDIGVLYRINILMIHGTDIVQKFIGNIVNFHHGKFYLSPVPMDKVFSPLPRIQPARL